MRLAAEAGEEDYRLLLAGPSQQTDRFEFKDLLVRNAGTSLR